MVISLVILLVAVMHRENATTIGYVGITCMHNYVRDALQCLEHLQEVYGIGGNVYLACMFFTSTLPKRNIPEEFVFVKQMTCH